MLNFQFWFTWLSPNIDFGFVYWTGKQWHMNFAQAFSHRYVKETEEQNWLGRWCNPVWWSIASQRRLDVYSREGNNQIGVMQFLHFWHQEITTDTDPMLTAMTLYDASQSLLMHLMIKIAYAQRETQLIAMIFNLNQIIPWGIFLH